MAKRSISTDGVVEPKTDAQKLAELKGGVPVIPPQPEVAAVMPTIPSVTEQDILSAFEANPALKAALASKLGVQAPVTKRVYSAGVANAVPTVRKSSQRDGFVEFSFDQKPDEATRTILKSAGFRWSNHNKVWYGPAVTLTSHERFGALVQGALQS